MWDLLPTFGIIAAIVYVVAKVWSHLANSIPPEILEELEMRRTAMRMQGWTRESEDAMRWFIQQGKDPRTQQNAKQVFAAPAPMTEDEKRQMAEHLRRLETAKDLSIERNEIRP